jgi:ribonuclease P protein component
LELLRLETLKRRADFNRVRRGRKWTGKGFLLQAYPQAAQSAGGARFGFVVASKSLRERNAGATSKRPGAVLRNRARRRLKEAVRLLAPDHAKPGFDYVVIGRYEALHQGFSDLLEELQLAFSKVNRQPPLSDAGAAPASGHGAPVRQDPRQNERLTAARSSASGLGQTQDG